MQKIKRIISIFLVSFILVNSITVSNVSAKTNDSEIVYVDGIGYTVLYEENGNITVSSLSKYKNSGSITIHSDGTAQAEIKNNGSHDRYNLVMNDLNSRKLNVDVYDNNNKHLKKYNNLNELSYDSYSCQSTGAVLIEVIIFSLTMLLDVIVSILPYVIVGGIAMYALSKVFEAIKVDSAKKGFYYSAQLIGKDVYVDKYNTISAGEAAGRIAIGLSIYTYEPMSARAVCNASGFGSIPNPEIDSYMEPGKIYYYHYHTANRNGAHAWFGPPYTK